MWPGSDDWQSTVYRHNPPCFFCGYVYCHHNDHLFRKDVSVQNYKEVRIGALTIRIPDPFPRQAIDFKPQPIRPFIILEERDENILKVVAVKAIGYGGMEGTELQWGSILVAVNDSGDKHGVVSDSYDPNDPIVWALDDAVLLVPRSLDSAVREKKRTCARE